jgi:hypothetical protein
VESETRFRNWSGAPRRWRGMDRSETLAFALMLLGRYLDAATTLYVVGSGLGFETNPFMRPWVSQPLALFAIQTLGGLLPWACLVAGARRGWRGFRRWLPLAAFLVSWPPVFNNLLVILDLPGPLALLYGGWSGG